MGPLSIEFSVIIPTCNRAKILNKALASLNRQTYETKKFEIIVIDDGGNDVTKKTVKKFADKSKIKTIYLRQKRKGPAAARNLGIKKAKGKYLLFINDDSVASKKLIEEHLKTNSKYSGKKIAVLGNLKWHPKIKITPFMEFLKEKNVWFEFDSIENKKTVPWNCFYTCNLSIEKNILGKERFDEKLKYAVGEDSELGYRLYKKGLKIIYNKKAVAYHFHEMHWEEWGNKCRNANESITTFYKKNPKVEIGQIKIKNDFDVPIEILKQKISKMEKNLACLKGEKKEQLFKLYQFLTNFYFFYDMKNKKAIVSKINAKILD